MAAYKKYTTIAGDTFDLVAYRAYGDSRHAPDIMAANSQYVDIAIFGAGVVLSVPDVEKASQEAADLNSLPPWRR